jgi:hypothetical protein
VESNWGEDRLFLFSTMSAMMHVEKDRQAALFFVNLVMISKTKY